MSLAAFDLIDADTWESSLVNASIALLSKAC